MIACLGWGSLVWDPRELPIQGEWFKDGPILPVEFARQSKDGRLTLVILPSEEGGTDVRTLWVPMSLSNIKDARIALSLREGCTADHIGIWPHTNGKGDPMRANIEAWATRLNLEGVVWTALPPKFNDEDDRAPTFDEAVQYLRSLSHEKRRLAENYIRKTPLQVDTGYRRRFELEFGWKPQESHEGR